MITLGLLLESFCSFDLIAISTGATDVVLCAFAPLIFAIGFFFLGSYSCNFPLLKYMSIL